MRLDIEQLLTPKQVAEAIGKTEGTLANYRTEGTGPEFVKVGRAVRYREADVQAWIRDCTNSAETVTKRAHSTAQGQL